jgi:hypothetical protein
VLYFESRELHSPQPFTTLRVTFTLPGGVLTCLRTRAGAASPASLIRCPPRAPLPTVTAWEVGDSGAQRKLDAKVQLDAKVAKGLLDARGIGGSDGW